MNNNSTSYSLTIADLSIKEIGQVEINKHPANLNDQERELLNTSDFYICSHYGVIDLSNDSHSVLITWNCEDSDAAKFYLALLKIKEEK